MRHGIAEDNSPTGKDADRRLTEEGREKLRDLLKVAAKAGVEPETIVSSPLVRARETAEIAKDILGNKDEIATSEYLTPDADPQDLWRELRTVYKGSNSVVLATHEPFAGRCTAYLLGAPELLIDFKKAGVVRIAIDQLGIKPRGILKWMLVPKLAAK